VNRLAEYKKLSKGRRFRIAQDVDTGLYTVGFWINTAMHSPSLASGDISASGIDLADTVQRFFEYWMTDD
jgi:hypothetical protein